jgi:hypothetical protein
MNGVRSTVLVTALIAGIATPAGAVCTPAFEETLHSHSAQDFYGNRLAISGTTLVVGTTYEDAAYVYEWNGASWVESQVFTSANGTQSFGRTVAIDGDWIVVGEPNNGSEKGSVTFFHFDGSQWVSAQQVSAGDGDNGDHFGNAVAIGGDVAVVGAADDKAATSGHGSAYVFRYDGSSWQQEQKLLAFDARRRDQYGRNVAVVPALNQVFVASSTSSGSGAVYVYTFDGASWNYETKLVPTTASPYFGEAMAAEGAVAVVGAYGAGTLGQNSGAAFVYRHDGTSWIREQRLLASDGGTSDRFGWSVAIQGGLVAIGTHNDGDQGFNVGSAYVFQYTGTKWRQAAKVYPTGLETDGYFGAAIGLGQGTLVVGQEGKDAVHVFDVAPCQP